MRKLTIIACLLVLSILSAQSMTLPSLASSGPAGLDEETQDSQDTPSKIETDYQLSKITADQRLLYLLYAVYDYDALPAAYHSQVPWSGTLVVAELKQTYAAIQAGEAPVSGPVQTEFERLLAPAAINAYCDEADGSSTYDTPHFRLSYGSIGGNLSFTHYADALETTFTTEVTSYGWGRPPLSANNTFQRYPVQISAIGGGLYGYVTYPGGSYTGFVGDNPYTPAVETSAMASCMVLNSNYSNFPGGPLYALQVTAAHEYVHAIQMGLGDPGSFEDDMIYESMATYGEDEVYDAANDNYNYLPPAYTSCLGQYSGNVYSNWLFFRYAAEANGGTNLAGGGEDVIQAFWGNIAAGTGALNAMNSALGVKGTTLADTYHRYAITARFMQSCPTSAPYCFEEAAGYLSAAGSPSNTGSIAAIGGGYSGSVQNNYALNWVGLPTSGSYNVTLSSTSTGQLRGSVVARTASGLTVTPFPAVVSPGTAQTLTAYVPPAGASLVVAVITNQAQTAANPSSCTANGYTITTAAAPPPGGFNKTAPINGAPGQTINPSLSWGTSTNATSYEYCYDTSNDSTCAGAWVSTGTSVSANLSGLSGSTTYYWQVRARNGSGTTEANSGAWWTFTTAAVLPGAFSKTAPLNGVTGQATSPTLSWGSAANAASYEYCYDTSNNDECNSTWVSSGTSTNANLSGLSSLTTYYWQVRARSAIGTTDANNGAWWSFVPGPPGAFNKTAPTSTANGQPLPASIGWNSSAGAASYEYCYDTSDDNDCDGAWTNAGSNLSVLLGNLTPGVSYYWQVVARNTVSTTEASNGWWMFTTTPHVMFLPYAR